MNCKPPCMAIIIRSDFPEHIGLPVEVSAESLTAYGDFHWLVHSRGFVRCFNNGLRREVVVNEFWVPDADLRPITGLPITDDVTDDEKVPA